MRISEGARTGLARIAREEFGGASMDEALRRLIFEHESRLAYERLASDPEALADYRSEAHELAEIDVEVADQVKSISVDRIVRPHDATLTGDEREAIRFALRQLIDL